jgi:hypothetical protein
MYADDERRIRELQECFHLLTPWEQDFLTSLLSAKETGGGQYEMTPADVDKLEKLWHRIFVLR